MTDPHPDIPLLEVEELARNADAQIQNLHIALSDLLNACGEILDPVLLGSYLIALRDHQQDARRVYDEIERFFLSEAGAKQVTVPGAGVIEVKVATKRTAWDHDSLIPVIVARALDERPIDEDGVFLEREAVTVARVLRECVSFGAGKVTGLRARGIDETEFCEVHEKAYGTKLPSRNEAA